MKHAERIYRLIVLILLAIIIYTVDRMRAEQWTIMDSQRYIEEMRRVLGANDLPDAKHYDGK